jgi:hypothetical protein
MKVKFVGFGGNLDVPVYQDESGKLYFDENNGVGELSLYTGAWKAECNEICGEPVTLVTELIECEKPFIRHAREVDYMLLGRLYSDCKCFIDSDGNCGRSRLWSDVETMLEKMEEILNSFAAEEKPEWLTSYDFVKIKDEILKIKKRKLAREDY